MNAKPPQFSIIIPSRDRPEKLRNCLTHLLDLDYPPGSWEVIIVDDGSLADYHPVIESFSDRLPLKYLRNATGVGSAAARNLGASAATADYFVFVDDDCYVMPDLLTSYAQGFSRTDKDALGGQSVPYLDDRAPISSRVWHHLVRFLYMYWIDDEQNNLIIISSNCAYRREVFEALEGFDPAFPMAASEDRDLSWRLLAHNYTQGICPGALVYHDQSQLSWMGYLQTQFRYGRGAYYFFEKVKLESWDEIERRFGNLSRINYVRKLLNYSFEYRLEFLDMLLLTAGYISHFAGKTLERLRVGISR